jgi:DUF917 family protein
MPDWIDAEAVDDIALGAGILGSGGGGDPQIAVLVARAAIAKYGPIRLLDVEDVPDERWLIPPAWLGAPTVTLEKLPSGGEARAAFEALERFLGERAFGAYPSEIGGANSLAPFPAAAEIGIPLIDADMMGRAFPEVQMTTAAMYGIRATPMSMADAKGNTVVIQTQDNISAEQLARALSVTMGGSASICNYAMTGLDAKQALVRGSLSRARSIGRALRESWIRKQDPVAGLIDLLNATLLCRGKIGSLQRRTERGFAMGDVGVEGSGSWQGQRLDVAFQNENIIARRGPVVAATTPDLISIVDDASGRAIATESLRYGQRVAVLGIPCDKKWHTPQGIALTGPLYFGYDVDYCALARGEREDTHA